MSRASALAFALLLVIPGPSGVSTTAQRRPPNIIFILADDLGIQDLGAYGRRDHRTPHLDRFAADGLRFTTAYVASPICSASRAAILTGRAPARLHLTTFLPGRPDATSQKLLHPTIEQQLPLTEVTLAERLRAAGYATAAIGKWHLGGAGFGPLEQGFDVYHPGQATTTPSDTEGGKGEYDLTREAERFIDANRERPFFLYLAHNSPHIPYAAPPKRVTANASALEPVYAATVETLDDSVGRLLEHLSTAGIRERTVVIFTSDNGGLHVPEGPHARVTYNTPFRAGKGYLYEGGLRVPLIVQGPGIAKGRVVDTPFLFTDWMPTLLELAGAPAAGPFDGISQVRLLASGASSSRPRPLFWHLPHYTNQGSRPAGAVREGQWKLVEQYDDGKAELFDLNVDIGEARDLTEQHPARAAALRARLREWRKSVGAQENTPNPNVAPDSYRRLYLDFDASRFDPLHADQAAWKAVANWRRLMDEAIRGPAQARAKPNVVIILVDDMGYGDTGAYNPRSKIATPSIDRLAREGMRFTDAHAAGAVCHPSRYGLMTGAYPFRTDVSLWPTQPLIKDGQTTIASLLKSNGYRTAMVGKWHLGFAEQGYDQALRGGPSDRGFDTFFGLRASTDIPPYFFVRGDRAVVPPTGHIDAGASEGWSPIQGAFWREGGIAPGLALNGVLPRLTDEAVTVIRDQATSPGARPLMLYVAFTAPHTPWLPSAEFQGRSQAGMYGDFATMVDAMIGRVLQALEDARMANDTLVIVTSDNGPVWYPEDVTRTGHDALGGLRGMKGSNWEGGHRMPFIVRWPGRVKAGAVSAQTICFTDVMATLADVMHATLPDDAGPDSVSFLPVLLGTQPARTPVRESLVVGQSIRMGEWKWIDGREPAAFQRPERGLVPAEGRQPGQLYNLDDDPAESKNLAADRPEIVARLKTERARIQASARTRR